jgi:hypothetical protein
MMLRTNKLSWREIGRLSGWTIFALLPYHLKKRKDFYTAIHAILWYREQKRQVGTVHRWWLYIEYMALVGQVRRKSQGGMEHDELLDAYVE